MKRLIFFIAFVVIIPFVSAQDKTNLIRYFQENDNVRLQKEIAKQRFPNTGFEALFFKAVFEPDAEKAFTIYQDVFKHSSGYTRYLAANRLKDYYYARGYYATAADYQKFILNNDILLDEKSLRMNNIPNEKPETLNQEQLYIQVGAFGLHENALQMQEMLKTQKIKSRIVLRMLKQKRFYCVWIPGKDDFKATLNFADELMEKYHLKYRLIKE